MKTLALCSASLGLFVTISAAEDSQALLARQIEEASTTSNQAYFYTGESIGRELYPPLIYRRVMQVQGCNVTARTIDINLQNATEKTRIEITFDLTRTRIPDSTVPIGDEYAFMIAKEDEQYGTALFELRFLPPYEPIIWSKVSGRKVEQPVSFTRFLMEPVPNEDQPRRLLALLNQYKSKYCMLFG